jgi:hypothetical protein
VIEASRGNRVFGWRVREHPPAAPRGERELIAVIAVTPETEEVPKSLKTWSGRRDSNPRRPAWEAGILPTELLPLSWLLKSNLFRHLLATRKSISMRSQHSQVRPNSIHSKGSPCVHAACLMAKTDTTFARARPLTAYAAILFRKYSVVWAREMIAAITTNGSALPRRHLSRCHFKYDTPQ